MSVYNKWLDKIIRGPEANKGGCRGEDCCEFYRARYSEKGTSVCKKPIDLEGNAGNVSRVNSMTGIIASQMLLDGLL